MVTETGEKAAEVRDPTGEPGVESLALEDEFEQARESRRAGLLLVAAGAVLMTLAATEAAAAGDGAPGSPPSGEARFEFAARAAP